MAKRRSNGEGNIRKRKDGNMTLSISKQAYRTKGELKAQPPKTNNSIRKISLSAETIELLKQEHDKHPGNPYLFPSPVTGGMYHPDSVVKLHQKILKDAGLEHIRFHDLRHPYVKPKTKKYGIIFEIFRQRQGCPKLLHTVRIG